jgi:hypothetical protein
MAIICQIVASALTSKETDDGVAVGPLLGQLNGSRFTVLVHR